MPVKNLVCHRYSLKEHHAVFFQKFATRAKKGVQILVAHGLYHFDGNELVVFPFQIPIILQQHFYLLGHSMGGAVVIQAMSGGNHPDVAGAILAAPAVWARSTIPFYQNGALWLVAHTIPWYRVTGEGLGRKPSDNIEMLREQGRDPLVIKETRYDTIYGLQNLMDAAYDSVESYTFKTLVLYGHLDEIIPEEPVLDAFRRFPADPAHQKKLIRYENGYHMLLRDLEAENVMKDIVEWLNE